MFGLILKGTANLKAIKNISTKLIQILINKIGNSNVLKCYPFYIFGDLEPGRESWWGENLPFHGEVGQWF